MITFNFSVTGNNSNEIKAGLIAFAQGFLLAIAVLLIKTEWSILNWEYWAVFFSLFTAIKVEST